MLRWGIAILSTVATFFLCEQIVRYVHPAPRVVRFLLGDKDSSYQLSKNPVLGYELKPNVRSSAPDCHNTFDYTNAFGMRDKERQRERAPGKQRIVLLGDSVLAGHGLCDVNDTLSRKLESLFPDGNTEVLNFGIGGYCTRAEVELFKEKGLQFKADRVALLFVGNDYINSNGSIIHQIKSTRPDFIEWVFKQSHIFRWLFLRLNVLGFADDFDPLGRWPENKGAIGDNNVEDGLRLLAKMAFEGKFKADILLWPRFGDRWILEPWPDGVVKPPEDTLPVEILAKELGMSAHRLSEHFRRDFAARFSKKLRGRNPTPLWTYTTGDGLHPSKIGAEVGAQAIHAALSDI